MPKSTWNHHVGPILTFLATAVLAAAGFMLPERHLEWMYAAETAAILLFFIAFGWAIQGTWKGIFTNRRNRWSLSNTQTMLWSVLIMGAFVAFWWMRIRTPGIQNPLAIGVDDSLVYLMGLTTASFGASAYIHHRKGTGAQTEDERNAFQTADLRWNFRLLRKEYLRTLGSHDKQTVRRALEPLRESLESLDITRRTTDLEDLRARTRGGEGAEVREGFLRWVEDHQRRAAPIGRLLRNLEPRQARPVDMFRSEEVGSAHRTDIGKAQLVVFTLVAMATFVYTTWNTLQPGRCATGDCLDHLPSLAGGFVSILLASHGGYLGTKAISHPAERWTNPEAAGTPTPTTP